MRRSSQKFSSEALFGTCGLLLAVVGFVCLAPAAQAVRIKDVCSIEGMRDNHLVGYGLVVGLKGTGDKRQTGFTIQTLTGFLRKNNIQVDPTTVDVKNVAAVMVTADLPPFARQGMRIDTVVSSIGDAENLQGGTLIATPLRPATANPSDPAQVYAIAQWNISTGGYAVSQAESSVVKNHPNVALIPNGAIIEREVKTAFATKPEINLLLHNPDFTTSVRVAEAINKVIGKEVATPRNATAVAVQMPEGGANERVNFVARIESLDVSPDAPARVVYNERTGTIVMGSNVRIATCIITHGNLILKTEKREAAALAVTPGPFGPTTTAVGVAEQRAKATEEPSRFRVMQEGVTVGDIAHGLNALGVSARDIISILQALKQVGALQADLVAM